ncbi:SRPBCC domain-containing protein [Xylophilus ampelinus]|uniref:Carbon monoxide dehydrogenase subunit G n=1 Tax=Xylophilus ampelinus TaxID=54067 RepID=A0A318SP90_9BURK|nr:carbon monoxide dehydrogenase subunit G [Xylophilus ampelinus]
MTAPGVFEVSAAFKIGLLSARFGGTISLTDVEPPHRYTIDVEGRGAAGFGRGLARVVLADAVAPRTGCTLRYTLQVAVGGKVAQVAGRWLRSTAEALVGKFFLRFDKALQQRLRNPA